MRQCKHCQRQTRSTDDVAWVTGWRWFQGTSQGGKEYSDVACPHCAGTRIPAEQSWDVECETCFWAFLGDDFEAGDEPLASARDAVAVAREHRCEPDVVLTDPDGNRRTLQDYDRDGNLRKP